MSIRNKRKPVVEKKGSSNKTVHGCQDHLGSFPKTGKGAKRRSRHCNLGGG